MIAISWVAMFVSFAQGFNFLDSESHNIRLFALVAIALSALNAYCIVEHYMGLAQ